MVRREMSPSELNCLAAQLPSAGRERAIALKKRILAGFYASNPRMS